MPASTKQHERGHRLLDHLEKELTVDELIAKVAERAGIDADQARKAIEAVVEQLEDRLPAPLGAQIQGLLDGDVDPGDLLKGLSGGLGGLLGR